MRFIIRRGLFGLVYPKRMVEQRRNGIPKGHREAAKKGGSQDFWYSIHNTWAAVQGFLHHRSTEECPPAALNSSEPKRVQCINGYGSISFRFIFRCLVLFFFFFAARGGMSSEDVVSFLQQFMAASSGWKRRGSLWIITLLLCCGQRNSFYSIW